MEFLTLESDAKLEEISKAKDPQIIFIHNTTCSISKGVLRSFKDEPDALPAGVPFYVLDMLTYQNISDDIAKRFDVVHQSPQLLLVEEGKCLYTKALHDITPEDTADAIGKLKN